MNHHASDPTPAPSRRTGRPFVSLHSSERGAALIIVLAFVVMLLVLLLAFFSKSTQQQQISKSSSTIDLTDIFAQGAVSTIVANLKQEIVDGSTATNIITTNALTGLVVTNTVYYPTTNSAGAPTTAVPQLMGCTTNTGAQLLNLVKISTNNLPFYSFTNNGILKTGVNNATTNSTTNASFNGRSISAARWNEALLLPVTDSNNYTPPSSNGFVPPSWILVARNGNNPTTFNTSTNTDMRWNTTNPTTVIGRYAYAIYNEGGLLDANVAGFPPVLTNPALPASVVGTNLYPAYKEGSFFADLTQIGMTIPQITALVGWRNYASSTNTGNFPNYTILPASGSNYSVAVLGNTNGFLQVATNTIPSGSQTLTDRQFTSRQQLITFLINADPNGVSNALTALQSLGTFSRSLEQPSYQPASNRPIVYYTGQTNSTNANIDYGVNGGNNAAGLDAQINPSFLTLRVTNSFTRTNVFTGSNTIAAVVGEPLIKQRFALNRLAWITYKGPSATLYKTTPNDPVLQYYISNGISVSLLTNGTAANIATYFGLTWSNAATPLGGCWYYNVHNGSANGIANATGVNNQGSINRLSAVAALPYPQGREPDFFELLKATQDVGSIAKGSIAGTNAAGVDTNNAAGSGYIPLNWQYKVDTSVDYAIIQLGANIIDQFDPDSFPTRIRFDDGSQAPNVFLKEFRGVEDLPYIYRIHYGDWIGRDSQNASGFGGFNATNFATIPPETNDFHHSYVHGTIYSGGNTPNFLSTLTDDGVGLLLALPDVWNPHSPSSTRLPNTTAQPTQPIRLRVTAMSETPDDILNGTTGSQGAIHVGSYTDSSTYAVGGAWPPNYLPGTNETAVTNGVAWSSYSYSAKTLTATPAGPLFANGYSNNLIITTNTSSVQFPYATNLFREPTLLAEYGKPTVGTVATTMVAATPDLVGVTAIRTGANNSGGTTLLSGGSLQNTKTLSIQSNSLGKPSGDSGQYVGIFIGIYPLRWVDSRASGFPGQITYQVFSTYLLNVGNTGVVPVPALTYLLQYQDPANPGNWITYDEKYGDVYAAWNLGVGMLQSSERPSALAYVDPRTSRFGAPELTGGGEYFQSTVVPQIMNTNAWLDSANNVLWSDRPDYGIGTAYITRTGTPSVASGWATFAAPGWHASGLGTPNVIPYYQPSLLSQNNPYFPNSGIYFTNQQAPSISKQDPVFYGDPDGVVRRAMGGYNTNANNPGYNGTDPSVGLPMAVANTNIGGTATPLPSGQLSSRPVMLNRPFRSVAELGYVFSGRPWRNIDFFTPESGESPFLDVFCINPPVTTTGMSAGKVSLNTRQTNVLAAILSGGYRDEANAANANPSLNTTINSNDATSMAAQIIAYTTTNPLANMADLVGRWKGTNQITNTSTVQFNTPLYTTPANNGTLFPYIDGSSSYVGLSTLFTNNSNFTNSQIQRFREAPIRALSAAGQTRVWNLLIDVVAQTGKYPPSATGADNFAVEGETRYWVHLAIDRLTGQVLDEQIEAVKD